MIKRNSRKGFTIVELVIVIAVIVILAAVLIPTFASIIKKANESVDMQVVKQMNTILQADEIASGKPATVVAAKEILVSNDCDDFTPAEKNNVYYWIGSENRVLLWTWENDEKTAGEVVFPKEYAKTYKDVTTPSADWKDLNFVVDETNYIELTVPEGGDLRSALLNAIKDAEDGAIIKLPANSVIDFGRDLHLIGEYLKNDGGTGKNISIDLNGSNLSGGYYSLEIPENGTLALVNGSLSMDEFSTTVSSIVGYAGSSIVLRDMEITSTGSAIFPKADASEVIIDNCKIVANGTYGIGTNRSTSRLIRVVINDSHIESKDCMGMLINTSGDISIDNSTVVGLVHGIVVRAGHVEIANSTIKATDTDPGIFSYKQFNSGKPMWLSGNAIAAGTIVIGDYSSGNSYSGDAVCNLINTKLETADSNIIPEIVLAARLSDKVASLTYDEASTVGRVVVYGEDFAYASGQAKISHSGSITVNGEAKTLS